MITGVGEATHEGLELLARRYLTAYGSPYFSDSPWTTSAQITDQDDTWNGAAALLEDRRHAT